MSQNDDYDPFDNESVPSLSFDGAPIGREYKFKVVEPAKLVQSRDFDTNEPATWPDGNPKMSAVLVVEPTGQRDSAKAKWAPYDDDKDEGPRSIWARKPSSMFAALAAAQREAGAKFTEGGTGTVRLSGEKPHENKRFNAIKQYAATYQPPAPADAFGDDQDSDEPPF